MRRWTNDHAELREYKPGLRTIFVGSTKYTLYFPYMIFVRRRHEKFHNSYGSVSDGYTLHFGCRTEPLPVEHIMDEVLLYPPVPNVYCKWLLVCCKPSVEAFWERTFNAYRWPGEALLELTGLKSYADWQKMSKDEVFNIFASKWPKEINFPHDPVGGLWNSGNSVQAMRTQYTVRDVVDETMADSAIQHCACQ